ncbi:5-hydroxytryptamine receptor 4 [Liparis tanakae]|uniref:5-hydroxytryptamine receptor 4 n=1 Tax=Liparis tanakae TaxID=230148 RepID=A0A4Z2J7I8_9TELE|nr:5-hydroxytryptamine receptor 4 [Liparis tanakae]
MSISLSLASRALEKPDDHRGTFTLTGAEMRPAAASEDVINTLMAERQQQGIGDVARSNFSASLKHGNMGATSSYWGALIGGREARSPAQGQSMGLLDDIEKGGQEQQQQQQQEELLRSLETIVLTIFLSVIIIMTVFGNLLVMVALCKDRHLRKKKTNYFIVSLAFADLLVALLVMPFAAIELTTGEWRYGEIFCLIEERRVLAGGSNDTSCVFLVNRPYALICSTVAFYVPLALMVLAYQRIYVTAMTHVRQIETLQRAGSAPVTGTTPVPTVRSSTSSDPSEHSRLRTTTGSPPSEQAPIANSRMRIETKAAKTLAVIMGCFCLCWAPFFITNVVDPFIHYSVPWQLWTAWLWLGYINSGLNPFLYAFLNRAFRRAFLVILCCGDERYARHGSCSYGHTQRPYSAASVNGTSMALR